MADSNFIDYVKIYCRSGNGGAGSTHMRREKYIPKGGPDGGDGGRGGHIILRANPQFWTLIHLKYRKHIMAEHGASGSGQLQHGKNGADIYLDVPLGTVAKDAETGEILFELVEPGEERILVIHTPGHTAGCVCFLCGENMLLTGDTLFAGGIGRCDLYSSDPLCMEASLKQLATLPPDLTIYPGHGPTMRLGDALDRAGL